LRAAEGLDTRLGEYNKTAVDGAGGNALRTKKG